MNLIFIPCYKTYADAGTLTVAGGTIGIGGLSAGALAGLAGPAVVAVFCGMLAVGVDIELTEASQQAGMTKTEYLKSKINEYCQEANTTANVFYKGITDNMSVTKNGAIELGDQASLQLKQFINWLYNNNMVNEPAQSSGDGVSLDGIDFPLTDSISFQEKGSSNVITYNTSIKVAIGISSFLFNGEIRYRPIFISNQSFNVSGWQTSSSELLNGYYYFEGASAFRESYYEAPSGFPFINEDGRDFVLGLDGSFDMSTGAESDGFTGERDEWNEKAEHLTQIKDIRQQLTPALLGKYLFLLIQMLLQMYGIIWMHYRIY